MADEVTKKDLQSLMGWVNAELKKRDTAIDKAEHSNQVIARHDTDDLAEMVKKVSGTVSMNQRDIAELVKAMDRLSDRVRKLEK